MLDDQFHGVERLPVGLALGEHGHDVLVLELRSGPSLGAEALQGRGLGQRYARQQLQGHVAIQRQLPGAIDHPHAAATELLDDLEVADALPGRRPVERGPGIELQHRAGAQGLGQRAGLIVLLTAGGARVEVGQQIIALGARESLVDQIEEQIVGFGTIHGHRINRSIRVFRAVTASA